MENKFIGIGESFQKSQSERILGCYGKQSQTNEIEKSDIESEDTIDKTDIENESEENKKED